MVPVQPIIDGLCKIGKKALPVLIKVFKNKKVQDGIVIGMGAGIDATLRKIQDKELTVKKKLKLLNKLKKKGEISEEDYKKHHDRILNSL